MRKNMSAPRLLIKDEKKRERDALQRELVVLRAGRAARIDEIAKGLKRSGVFKERHDDPIIRVRFLKDLKTDPDRGDVVSQISLMIKLFIMFLEIAPVVGKMFFSPPSAYAWKIQKEVGEHQLAAMAELDSRIDEYQQQHIANVETLDKLIQERQERQERDRVWEEAQRSAFEKMEQVRKPEQ